MPGIFFEPSSRRNFFKVTSTAFLAATLTRRLAAETEKSAESFRLALLSDTHFPVDPTDGYRGFLPAENLKKILPQVEASKSAAVLINGDAARFSGLVEDYEKLKEALTPIASKTPIIVAMGNHDDRENFAKVLPPTKLKQEVAGKQVLVLEEVAMRFVVLDSLLYVNKTAGLLGKNQREWLQIFLEKSDEKPTIVFVHHTLGDNDGELLDAEKFLKMVIPHQKVKAIFYGHSHKYNQTEQGGLHLVNLPAVGYNFNDAEPLGWVQADFGATKVDLTLHAFAGNTDGNGKTISLEWR